MLIVLGLAAGLVFGAPLPSLALLGFAAWQPVLFLAVVAIWAAFGRPPAAGVTAEATLLQAVAAELRSGASLRQALAGAAGRVSRPNLTVVSRLALAGRPLEEIADALGPALPGFGHLAASALRAAGSTGGRAAQVFDDLALIAFEDADLIRRRRVATAQARFSAWIVGGMPIAYLLYAGTTGRLDALRDAGGAGAVLLGLGFGFLITGVAVVWSLLRRASR